MRRDQRSANTPFYIVIWMRYFANFCYTVNILAVYCHSLVLWPFCTWTVNSHLNFCYEICCHPGFISCVVKCDILAIWQRSNACWPTFALHVQKCLLLAVCSDMSSVVCFCIKGQRHVAQTQWRMLREFHWLNKLIHLMQLLTICLLYTSDAADE